MSQFTESYNTFFKSPAGVYFLTNIMAIIDDEHEAAENDPELARDHTQRAKGVREVLKHIQSMQVVMKK